MAEKGNDPPATTSAPTGTTTSTGASSGAGGGPAGTASSDATGSGAPSGTPPTTSTTPDEPVPLTGSNDQETIANVHQDDTGRWWGTAQDGNEIWWLPSTNEWVGYGQPVDSVQEAHESAPLVTYPGPPPPAAAR